MPTHDTDPRTAACTGFWQAVSARLESLRALPARELMEGLNELLEPFFPRLAAEVAGEPPEFKLVLTAHGSVDDFEDLMALGEDPANAVETDAMRGLARSARLVERHGGSMALDIRPGKRCTVVGLSWPRHQRVLDS